MNGEPVATLDAPSPTAPDYPPAPAPRRRLAESPLLKIGLGVIGVFLVLAIVAPLLTPYDPRGITGAALEQPSGRHWLGTDVPGRDIFAQLLEGSRASLTVALVGGSLAMLGAILIGVLPALVGGRADVLSSRLVVFLLALPGAPLLILIGSLAGNRRIALMLVIGFVGAAPNARVLRGPALSLRRRGFIVSARAFGGGPLYVLRRHLVPGLGPLILVRFANWAGIAIALEAGLAFIGLGNPSDVSWGLMINRALTQPAIYLSPMWVWWVLPPGIAITLAVLGFTFVGVGLEPSFNPRSVRSF